MLVSRTSSVVSFELVDEQLKRVESVDSLASFEVGDEKIEVKVEDEELKVDVEEPKKVSDELDEEQLKMLQDALKEVVPNLDDKDEEEIRTVIYKQHFEQDQEVKDILNLPDAEPAELQHKLKELEGLLRKAELERAVLRIKSAEEKEEMFRTFKSHANLLLEQSKLKSDALLEKSELEKEALEKLLRKTDDEMLVLANEAHVAKQEMSRMATEVTVLEAKKLDLEKEVDEYAIQAQGEEYMEKMVGEWVLTSVSEKRRFLNTATTHRLPYRLAALFSTIKCTKVGGKLHTMNTLCGKRFNRNTLTLGSMECKFVGDCLLAKKRPTVETKRQVEGDVLRILHSELDRSYQLEYKRVTKKYQKITSLFNIAYKLVKA